MREFLKVGRVEEFREGRGRAVKVDGVAVAVFRVGERIFALRDACPHMGASLAEGKPEGMQVECHWHHWRFDLESGCSTEREWACAAVYEVRLDGGDVWLRPPIEEPASAPDDENDPDWIFWDSERYFRKDGPSSAQGRPDGDRRTDQADQRPDQEDPADRGER